MSLGGSVGVARIGVVIHGASGWCQVTCRANKRSSPSRHPGAGSNPARDYTQNLGNNTYGPGDPSSAVAAHCDKRAGGRAAVAAAGGSHRKYHGGKATRRLLMLPPCCSTPMPRVATPARGSFLPRRYNPVSLPGGCPGTAVELQVAPRVQP